MKLNDKIVFLLLKFFSLSFKLFGIGFVRAAAKALGFTFYYLVPIRKKVALENLTIAFPEKSIKEIKIIAKKTYQNILTTFFELIYLQFASREQIKAMLEIENFDYIKSIYEEKKGLIIWTGHFGSWEIGAAGSPVYFNQPVHLLAKKQSNDYLNEFAKNAREKYGNKIVWLGVSVRNLIEVLRSGGIIGIVGDQRGPAENVRITFFGRPTPFYTGAATLIGKIKCNAIFAVAIRQPNGNYKSVFEKVDLESLPQDLEEKVKEINQRYANFLEKYIKQYPDQYFWMHKIWKY